MDLTATDVAQLCDHSVRSVNAVYQRIRVRLAQECAAQSPFSGELEADESYFSSRPIHGKRGRGAGGKTIVFGLPKRGDVYTEIIPNVFKATLQAIIRGKVDPNSLIHTDGWRGYDGRVDLGLEKHFRVNHGNNGFVKGFRHVSTASSLSGAMPSIGWLSTMVCEKTSSSCISRRPSFASTTDTLTSTRHCLNRSETTLWKAFDS